MLRIAETEPKSPCFRPDMPSLAEMLREGLDHHRAGRLKQAEHAYRKLLDVHPRHAGAVHLLGLIAFQAGKTDLAIHYLQSAIKLDRFQAAFKADLGEIYRSKGQTGDAIGMYREAIALNPEDPHAQNHLGTLYQTSGDFPAAEGCFREAMSLQPDFAEAQRHLGEVLAAMGRLEEGRAELERSVQLDATAAASYLALGDCLYSLGKSLDAIACYQKAAYLQADMAPARYHVALVRLAEGDFEHGWQELAWRLKCPSHAIADSKPMWNGGSLDERRIVIHSEGTLSDVLQFARYVPIVTRRGGEVFFEVPEKLVPLLAVSGFDNLIARGTTPPPCDLQVPLLSLPQVVGTRLDTVPAEVPYLAASADLERNWREKLRGLTGIRVGICWQDDPASVGDVMRSIPLAAFAPLANVAGVTLISLQRVHGVEQLAGLGGSFQVVDLGDDVDTRHGAFMDTAAIMKSLDLIVTCDSAIAHLAGALKLPLWIAVSGGTQWRWMRDRTDTPWYPTARLFRQTRLSEWSDVMARMAETLATLAASSH